MIEKRAIVNVPRAHERRGIAEPVRRLCSTVDSMQAYSDVRRRFTCEWIRSCSLLFVALTLGLAFAHVLESVGWTPQSLPADWVHVRNRWEIGHAIQAALFAFGFVALAAAVLVEKAVTSPTAR